MQDDHDDTDTPGWDAINAALAPLYAGQEPRHFGTALPYTLGGQDPLDGISVYWADAPVPHWHYITYGFSELYAKESSDADASGYGFELTFRLAAEAGENAGSTPPVATLTATASNTENSPDVTTSNGTTRCRIMPENIHARHCACP